MNAKEELQDVLKGLSKIKCAIIYSENPEFEFVEKKSFRVELYLLGGTIIVIRKILINGKYSIPKLFLFFISRAIFNTRPQ